MITALVALLGYMLLREHWQAEAMRELHKKIRRLEREAAASRTPEPEIERHLHLVYSGTNAAGHS